MQINKDNTRENRHRVEYDYKVNNNVILNKHTVYKLKTPYMVPFVITQCFTNGTLNLQCDAIQIKSNIRRINPYKLDTIVEDYNSISMYGTVNI